MEETKNASHHGCVHCEDCPHKDQCKGGMCGAGMCGVGGMGYYGGHGMRHRAVRWILGIIIILGLLWLGTKIGEFKAMCGSGLYRGGSYNQMMVPFGR